MTCTECGCPKHLHNMMVPPEGSGPGCGLCGVKCLSGFTVEPGGGVEFECSHRGGHKNWCSSAGQDDKDSRIQQLEERIKELEQEHERLEKDWHATLDDLYAALSDHERMRGALKLILDKNDPSDMKVSAASALFMLNRTEEAPEVRTKRFTDAVDKWVQNGKPR